jgi:nucleoside 2-deoxyribosyltransferase
MKRIYIASPYTKGDAAVNVKRQIDTFDALIKMGFIPFAPLLLHFQHMVHPLSYSECMRWDLAWLEQCDCVLRLEGDSKGADMEVEWAMSIGKIVFYSIDELKLYVETYKN